MPRRAEDTVLYGIVREHLEPFVEHASEAYQKPLPRYVVAELRGYLRCGVFAYSLLLPHAGIERGRLREVRMDAWTRVDVIA